MPTDYPCATRGIPADAVTDEGRRLDPHPNLLPGREKGPWNSIYEAVTGRR
jgi:hypothetical protein